MTSEANIRKRQYRLGIFVMILAIITASTAVWLTIQDDRTRDCFQEEFAQFAATLETRSKLAEQESILNRRESEAVNHVLSVYAEAAGLLRDDPTKELPPEQEEQLERDLVEALIEFDQVTKDVASERIEIREARKNNPVPAYPDGVC